MYLKYAAYGAVHAMLAVVLGAFGAHGLEARLSEHMLTVFETGVRYHMYHGLGILLIAAFAERLGEMRAVVWAMRLLMIGIVLFSGSLYVLSLSGFTKLGMITPLGGVAFIAGWIMFASAAWRQRINK
ncbi:DUF423 domain-containing protein [Paenibacillus abyssi]|uniref:UPF0382 membrane protein YwdK n=1 Tax=Paenibacillus abyssi TaxID=1340531 RepID=A0A917G795_9BACL|nr:DUF423 domain-containing protein [Paenibacillus abyssi]GGG26177.1 UPF0382 membrane protein YwdK [Paenibacillus abyssi]